MRDKGRSFLNLKILTFIKHIGQYFRLINYDKKEYIEPWDLGGGAKLCEWCANNKCRILPFLLRQSNEGGGGDIRKDYKTAGRWAGNRVAMVGDYDQSNDYDRAGKKFSNISRQAARDFNDFIELDDYKLRVKPKNTKSG